MIPAGYLTVGGVCGAAWVVPNHTNNPCAELDTNAAYRPSGEHVPAYKPEEFGNRLLSQYIKRWIVFRSISSGKQD